MTKVCSVCDTDNKDEAQFCRSCGTSFTASPPMSPAAAPVASVGASDNVCGECGFQNKPGIRYCANCGMSLTTAASGFGDLAKPVVPPASASAGQSPPPITYQSFAPVAPYPSAPTTASSEGALFDDLAPPDLPDPDAAIAARQATAAEHYAPPIESGFSSPDDVFEPPPNRGRLVAIAGAAALVVLGVAAWWFMGSRSSAPAESAAAPAPAVVATPAPTPAPAPAVVASAPELAPVIVEAASAPASAPVVEATAPAPMPVPTPTATTAPAVTPSTTTTLSGTVSNPPPAAAAALPQTLPPAAAAPLPRKGDVVPTDASASEAKRLAADKARRDKATRDKADRDAKALAQQQRDQAAAGAKAEQDAQAKRRADDAQRARAAAVPAPALTPAAPAQPRGVRELCAGRGAIAEAVCQSRQCAGAEHANEPICRQIREADDRRRNYQN